MFFETMMLFLVLFNPFLMSIYLLELVKKLSLADFSMVLTRANLISGSVFILFALTGEAFFSKLLQVRFAAFLVFGGLVFFGIAMQQVFNGTSALLQIRGGPPKQLAGTVAMPFMIGPGTVSASVFAGSRLSPLLAIICIAASLAISMVLLIVLKYLHDVVAKRQEALVERYVEVMGRVSALIMGTIAVEMVIKGIDMWLGLNNGG